MRFPTPDVLLAPLTARLPTHPAWLPRAVAGAGLAGAAAAIAFHHHWIGAGLLLAGLAAAAVGAPGLVLCLGLLALTVLTVLRGGNVSAVTWGVAAGLWFAAIFPDRFSLLAYLIGVMVFVWAGQGVAERRS